MVCQSAPPASSPAPRLRARSMLSLGTEFFLAFWMASYSVGLPAGSPPPTRAATSMFLISRAKFLPRRASITAFLCLVVAHLEWPLMQVLPLSCSKSARRVYVDPFGEVAIDVPLQIRRHRGQHFVLAHRRDRLDLPDVAQQRQAAVQHREQQLPSQRGVDVGGPGHRLDRGACPAVGKRTRRVPRPR